MKLEIHFDGAPGKCLGHGALDRSRVEWRKVGCVSRVIGESHRWRFSSTVSSSYENGNQRAKTTDAYETASANRANVPLGLSWPWPTATFSCTRVSQTWGQPMALGRTYDRLDSPTATMVCLLVLHLGAPVRGGAGAIQILAHVAKFDRSIKNLTTTQISVLLAILENYW